MDHMSMAGDGDASSCKISMLWNWTTVDACFLASSWHVRNNGMFAVSCIGVALLTVCLEGLRRACREYDMLIQRQWRAYAVARSKEKSSLSSSLSFHTDAELRAHFERSTITLHATPLQQAIRATLHAVTFGVAYIIMLLAMYFNGYIIISIIIGAGLGKFFCDWITATLPLRNGQENEADPDIGKESPAGGALEEPTVCCG